MKCEIHCFVMVAILNLCECVAVKWSQEALGIPNENSYQVQQYSFAIYCHSIFKMFYFMNKAMNPEMPKDYQKHLEFIQSIFRSL